MADKCTKCNECGTRETCDRPDIFKLAPKKASAESKLRFKWLLIDLERFGYVPIEMTCLGNTGYLCVHFPDGGSIIDFMGMGFIYHVTHKNKKFCIATPRFTTPENAGINNQIIHEAVMHGEMREFAKFIIYIRNDNLPKKQKRIAML